MIAILDIVLFMQTTNLLAIFIFNCNNKTNKMWIFCLAVIIKVLLMLYQFYNFIVQGILKFVVEHERR